MAAAPSATQDAAAPLSLPDVDFHPLATPRPQDDRSATPDAVLRPRDPMRSSGVADRIGLAVATGGAGHDADEGSDDAGTPQGTIRSRSTFLHLQQAQHTADPSRTVAPTSASSHSSSSSSAGAGPTSSSHRVAHIRSASARPGYFDLQKLASETANLAAARAAAADGPSTRHASVVSARPSRPASVANQDDAAFVPDAARVTASGFPSRSTHTSSQHSSEAFVGAAPALDRVTDPIRSPPTLRGDPSLATRRPSSRQGIESAFPGTYAKLAPSGTAAESIDDTDVQLRSDDFAALASLHLVDDAELLIHAKVRSGNCQTAAATASAPPSSSPARTFIQTSTTGSSPESDCAALLLLVRQLSSALAATLERSEQGAASEAQEARHRELRAEMQTLQRRYVSREEALRGVLRGLGVSEKRIGRELTRADGQAEIPKIRADKRKSRVLGVEAAATAAVTQGSQPVEGLARTSGSALRSSGPRKAATTANGSKAGARIEEGGVGQGRGEEAVEEAEAELEEEEEEEEEGLPDSLREAMSEEMIDGSSGIVGVRLPWDAVTGTLERPSSRFGARPASLQVPSLAPSESSAASSSRVGGARPTSPASSFAPDHSPARSSRALGGGGTADSNASSPVASTRAPSPPRAQHQQHGGGTARSPSARSVRSAKSTGATSNGSGGAGGGGGSTQSTREGGGSGSSFAWGLWGSASGTGRRGVDADRAAKAGEPSGRGAGRGTLAGRKAVASVKETLASDTEEVEEYLSDAGQSGFSRRGSMISTVSRPGSPPPPYQAPESSATGTLRGARSEGRTGTRTSSSSGSGIGLGFFGSLAWRRSKAKDAGAAQDEQAGDPASGRQQVGTRDMDGGARRPSSALGIHPASSGTLRSAPSTPGPGRYAPPLESFVDSGQSDAGGGTSGGEWPRSRSISPAMSRNASRARLGGSGASPGGADEFGRAPAAPSSEGGYFGRREGGGAQVEEAEAEQDAHRTIRGLPKLAAAAPTQTKTQQTNIGRSLGAALSEAMRSMPPSPPDESKAAAVGPAQGGETLARSGSPHSSRGGPTVVPKESLPKPTHFRAIVLATRIASADPRSFLEATAVLGSDHAGRRRDQTVRSKKVAAAAAEGSVVVRLARTLVETARREGKVVEDQPRRPRAQAAGLRAGTGTEGVSSSATAALRGEPSTLAGGDEGGYSNARGRPMSMSVAAGDARPCPPAPSKGGATAASATLGRALGKYRVATARRRVAGKGGEAMPPNVTKLPDLFGSVKGSASTLWAPASATAGPPRSAGERTPAALASRIASQRVPDGKPEAVRDRHNPTARKVSGEGPPNSRGPPPPPLPAAVELEPIVPDDAMSPAMAMVSKRRSALLETVVRAPLAPSTGATVGSATTVAGKGAVDANDGASSLISVDEEEADAESSGGDEFEEYGGKGMTRSAAATPSAASKGARNARRAARRNRLRRGTAGGDEDDGEEDEGELRREEGEATKAFPAAHLGNAAGRGVADAASSSGAASAAALLTAVAADYAYDPASMLTDQYGFVYDATPADVRLLRQAWKESAPAPACLTGIKVGLRAKGVDGRPSDEEHDEDEREPIQEPEQPQHGPRAEAIGRGSEAVDDTTERIAGQESDPQIGGDEQRRTKPVSGLAVTPCKPVAEASALTVPQQSSLEADHTNRSKEEAEFQSANGGAASSIILPADVDAAVTGAGSAAALGGGNVAKPSTPGRRAPSTSHTVRRLLSELQKMYEKQQTEQQARWDDFLRRRRAAPRERIAADGSGVLLGGGGGSVAGAGKRSSAYVTASSTSPVIVGEEASWGQGLVGINSMGDSKLGREHRAELVSLCRRGIPMCYRAKVWAEASGALDAAEPGRYAELLQRHEAEANACTEQIDLDVHRTMPTNLFFGGEGPGVPKLRRLLVAFSWYDPACGYCQGMNNLAATLLLTHATEEEAFWVFVCMIERILPAEYYTSNLLVSQADQRVLVELMHEVLPSLGAHLDDLGVDLPAVTFAWFLSLYTDCLPVETLFRVWDLVFVEGDVILFQVGLAILATHLAELLATESASAFYGLVHSITSRLFNVDGLIKVATEELGPKVTPAKVASKRARHVAELRVELGLDEVGVVDGPAGSTAYGEASAGAAS